ncbi:MAG: hypothetical protein R2862_05385 [Thermoanaerobaculia bacterium]
MSVPVEEARREFERALTGVRRELDHEFGWTPRGIRWLAPLGAAVAGFVAAVALRRALSRRRD